jgi:hypothetical protein
MPRSLLLVALLAMASLTTRVAQTSFYDVCGTARSHDK